MRGWSRSTRGRSTARPGRALRVATVLVLVALVPLAGTAAVVVGEVRDASRSADAAARLEASAERAIGLSELQAAVLDEMNARSAVVAVGTLAMPSTLVRQLMGVDLDAQLAAADARVDAIIAELGLADVGRAVTEVRAAATSMSECLQRYEALAAVIDAQQRATFTALVEGSTTVHTDGPALFRAVQNLQAAERARRAVARQQAAYFASRYAIRDTPAAEIANLMRIRDEYATAMAELQATATATATATARSEALQRSIEVVRADERLVAQGRLTDAIIADALEGGVPSAAPAFTFEAVFSRVDELQVVYGASQISTSAHLSLVDNTAGEVLVQAGALRADAVGRARTSSMFAAALALVTLAAAALATRFIVRPLRGLRDAANALRAGHGTATAALVGPIEVRAAAAAIDDAATYLELATRQAQSLAAGDLDAAVLDQGERSGLGQALQDAVGTLRGALGKQDEFRRRLAHEAAHDGLTRLPNRSASMAQLARSLARTARSDAQLAVLFIDLDHFKEVNDHHGHQAGDIVLTAVAERLVTRVREGDHVGRLGGDEFVVIAEPVADLPEAVALAQRLLAAVNEPIDIRTTHVHVGASIGIALATEDLTADELLRDADLAVYRVKELGRGGVEICNEDLRAKMVVEADLTTAIRQAIDGDELLLHYQPIVESVSGAIKGLEALVRWRRPGREGLVPPDQFIPLAERSALIIDLDRWVLGAVAAQIARWDETGRYCDLPVSVNVSSRHLGHDDFVRHVLEPLERAGVDPGRIVIEVTETALLDDLSGASVKLERLRRTGVRVAIDDFGTGYTSLAHLRSLPIDILKIDRSFTANVTTSDYEASIVQLIIDTGHLLGASVTVEGVETVGEAAKLTALGSDSLQGFYFARPQPPECLTETTVAATE